MTNREMAKGATKGVDPDDKGQRPNTQALPPMPAPEDSRAPATDLEPIDSPQPNASVQRAPPSADKPGLATKR